MIVSVEGIGGALEPTMVTLAEADLFGDATLVARTVTVEAAAGAV